MAKQRMRRAYLKRFSSGVINTGKAEHSNEEALRVMLPAGRQKAIRSIAEGVPLPKLKGSAVAVVANLWEVNGQQLVVGPARVETLAKMWQTWNRQGFDQCHFVTVMKSKRTTLRLGALGSVWFYIREHHLLSIGERSVAYNSREIAEWHRRHGRITYEEEFSLVLKEEATTPGIPEDWRF